MRLAASISLLRGREKESARVYDDDNVELCFIPSSSRRHYRMGRESIAAASLAAFFPSFSIPDLGIAYRAVGSVYMHAHVCAQDVVVDDDDLSVIRFYWRSQNRLLFEFLLFTSVRPRTLTLVNLRGNRVGIIHRNLRWSCLLASSLGCATRRPEFVARAVCMQNYFAVMDG